MWDQRAGGQQQLLCLYFVKKHREIQKLLPGEPCVGTRDMGEVVSARRMVKLPLAAIHPHDAEGTWTWGDPSHLGLLFTDFFYPVSVPFHLQDCRIMRIRWQWLRRCLGLAPSAWHSFRNFPGEERRLAKVEI